MAPHRAPTAPPARPRRAGDFRNILRSDRILDGLNELEGELEASANDTDLVMDALPDEGTGEKPERPPREDTRSDVPDDIPSQGDLYTRQKQNKRDRGFKDRGSVLSKLSKDAVVIRGRARGPEDTAKPSEVQKKPKKNKPKVIKALHADVFIPSVVSVQNLARLLKVRLGMTLSSMCADVPHSPRYPLETLQRVMIKAGMEAESSHNHSMLTFSLHDQTLITFLKC